jgi:hypothetical protein
VLCDTVILYASPHRGAPPPKLKFDRREERPCHTPEFFPEIAVAKAKLKRQLKPLNNKECRAYLESIVLKIFQEAEESKPAAPAYFDLALALAERLNLCLFRKWLEDQDLANWHPYLVTKIKRIVSDPHRL